MNNSICKIHNHCQNLVNRSVNPTSANMSAHRDVTVALAKETSTKAFNPSHIHSKSDAMAVEMLRREFQASPAIIPDRKETARVLYATKIDFPEATAAVPGITVMSRNSAGLDPAQRLLDVKYEEMQKVLGYNSYKLSAFFKQKGFKELPKAVLQHNLAGNLLGSIHAADIDKLRLNLLGEAKALEQFCAKLGMLDRQLNRKRVYLEQRLAWTHEQKEFKFGPCSQLNCWSERLKYRCTLCLDLRNLFCNPIEYRSLPLPKLVVTHDKLTIVTAVWKNGFPYHEQYVPVNEKWEVFSTDNIDFTTIVDVDWHHVPRVDNYQASIIDVCYQCFCCELAQHPHGGDWYWINPIERCCGFLDTWENRIDGKIQLDLDPKSSEGQKRPYIILPIRQEKVDDKSPEEITNMILHQMEEAQDVIRIRSQTTHL